MGEHEEYRAAIDRTRAAGYGLGRQGVATVTQALEDAAAAVERGITEGTINVEKAALLRRSIIDLLAQFSRVAANTTQQAVTLTVRQVTEIHRQVTAGLVEAAGLDATATAALFNTVPTRALAALGAVQERRSGAIYRTLIRRHMTQAVPDVDRVINAGLARGMDARRIARDIAGVMLRAEPDLVEYGLRESLSGLGTILSDAKMIALSETLNAMREANAVAMQASPVVKAMKWQTSGGHGGLPSSPDVCDDLAAGHGEGLPPGYYRPAEFPVAQHPRCGCYAGDVLLLPVEQWGQGTDRGERAPLSAEEVGRATPRPNP